MCDGCKAKDKALNRMYRGLPYLLRMGQGGWLGGEFPYSFDYPAKIINDALNVGTTPISREASGGTEAKQKGVQ